LKRVFCAGEALGVDLVERFFNRLPGVELINTYGPTEAAIDVTYWPCPRGDRLQTIPIGKPMANTQVYVLDRHNEPVPVGVMGELHLAGANLARGYLNRPDLTAERFIPNPFSPEPGARLYRTGDWVRWLPDGTLDFLRRIDHQVKLRGFRIELGEIETALERHSGVCQAVAVVREDRPGDKRLVAYIVAREASPPSAKELRSYLRDELPDYMIPSAFVALPAMPLTPSGKVDRRTLPSPDEIQGEAGAEFTPPRTSTEKALAEIWAEVLGVEWVGLHDNFFDLGGHSLLAIQIISRVREVFSVELPMRDLFAATTLVDMATLIVRCETERVSSEDLDQLLKELEGLSEEEVQALLESETQQ
jgi:acyl carrier protein